MIGCALPGRLYSPKCVKDLKFVAHNSTLMDDFIRNHTFYVVGKICLFNIFFCQQK